MPTVAAPPRQESAGSTTRPQSRSRPRVRRAECTEPRSVVMLWIRHLAVAVGALDYQVQHRISESGWRCNRLLGSWGKITKRTVESGRWPSALVGCRRLRLGHRPLAAWTAFTGPEEPFDAEIVLGGTKADRVESMRCGMMRRALKF
jgi:hypothetical protein